MTTSDQAMIVRVSRHFDASAERVYDAFLDATRARRFLFVTPTGQIVRCDIDPRVGGEFAIVDRRGNEDVLHSGKYLELARPRRIVFELVVPKYSSDVTKVTIDITPLTRGCELTLTHETVARGAGDDDRTEEGWRNILDLAAELLVDDQPTCGIGLAEHATVLDNISVMLDGLAETLELHRQMLVLTDERSRKEDVVYGELASSWRRISAEASSAAAMMFVQRELPMGAHDPAAWGAEHRRAFEKFVNAQSRLLGLLRIAAERDEKMLASM